MLDVSQHAHQVITNFISHHRASGTPESSPIVAIGGGWMVHPGTVKCSSQEVHVLQLPGLEWIGCLPHLLCGSVGEQPASFFIRGRSSRKRGTHTHQPLLAVLTHVNTACADCVCSALLKPLKPLSSLHVQLSGLAVKRYDEAVDEHLSTWEETPGGWVNLGGGTMTYESGCHHIQNTHTYTYDTRIQ